MRDPFHPAYGLPVETRLAAIAAAQHLPKRQVAEHFRIALSTLYMWINAYRSLQ